MRGSLVGKMQFEMESRLGGNVAISVAILTRSTLSKSSRIVSRHAATFDDGPYVTDASERTLFPPMQFNARFTRIGKLFFLKYFLMENDGVLFGK